MTTVALVSTRTSTSLRPAPARTTSMSAASAQPPAAIICSAEPPRRACHRTPPAVGLAGFRCQRYQRRTSAASWLAAAARAQAVHGVFISRDDARGEPGFEGIGGMQRGDRCHRRFVAHCAVFGGVGQRRRKRKRRCMLMTRMHADRTRGGATVRLIARAALLRLRRKPGSETASRHICGIWQQPPLRRCCQAR